MVSPLPIPIALGMPYVTLLMKWQLRNDGYVKSPDAALHFILRHCGVRKSTPHSSGFVRLACGLFTKPSPIHGF